MRITVNTLAKMIDHSLLHPTMTDKILQKECRTAVKYNVASVCIKPYAVKQAVELVKGADVMVGSVIGFPHGNSTKDIKVMETVQACQDGAVEIDMVINIGKALGENWEYVEDEINVINDVAVSNNAILKVIFENDFLEDKHIVKLCKICNRIEPAFVKTSTGYGFVKQSNGMYSYDGATEHGLKLMRQHSRDNIEVKAAGGVRTLEDLLAVRTLGVTRVGATATSAILDKAKSILDKGEKLENIKINNFCGGGY